MKLRRTHLYLVSASIWLEMALQSGLAQTNFAPQPLPSMTILTDGLVYSKEKSKAPSVPGAEVSCPDTPLPYANFLGLDRGSSGFFGPPDTEGTVGSEYVMTLLNHEVEIQTRSGGFVLRSLVTNFWASTNIGNFASPFDPRTAFDPYAQRWIAIAAIDEGLLTSGILLGVSRTSNPTNIGDVGWNLRRIAADPNASSNSFLWVDSPTMGFNKDWIVVQANMVRTTNVNHFAGFDRSHIWVFNKTNLYAGGFTAPTLFAHTETNAAGSELPALTYDKTNSTLYLIQNANGNLNGSGYLRLFSITGSIGSEKLNYVIGGGSELTNARYIIATNVSWTDTLPNNGWNDASFQPQRQPPGSTNTNYKLATAPDARPSSVIFRNGSLWFAQTILLPAGTNYPTRSAIQWWQIKPDSFEIVQRGRIDDPGGTNFYAYPSIAVNRFNDVLVGYNVFSSNIYPSAAYAFRAFNDQCNGLRAGYVYQPGLDTYFRVEGDTFGGRWGDYSASVIDPLNDADFWTVQEYSITNKLNDDGNLFSVWGTRWAQVKMDLPANDNFSASVSISGPQGSTNGNNIRATGETGEPAHAGNLNTVSVWYNWTTPSNGAACLTITNATFDTALAVYTGSSVTNLTLVASNQGIQLPFTASAGTSYKIAVDGLGNSPFNQGTFTLQWSQPFAPMFTLQPDSWDVFMGSNVTFSATAIGNPSPSYQWRFNGTNVANETNSTYTRNNVQTNDTGNFTVVATNSSGSATSIVAHLEVYSTQKALLSNVSYSAPSNYVRFIVSGITGAHYAVSVSTNLTNWTPIYTNITTFTNIDSGVTNTAGRFYRVLYQP